MDDSTRLLKALVFAVGHAPACPCTEARRACRCGKAAQLAMALGEACSYLRGLGEIK